MFGLETNCLTELAREVPDAWAENIARVGQKSAQEVADGAMRWQRVLPRATVHTLHHHLEAIRTIAAEHHTCRVDGSPLHARIVRSAYDNPIPSTLIIRNFHFLHLQGWVALHQKLLDVFK